MAKKRNKPFGRGPRKLETLPQRFDVWQLDARLAAAAIPSEAGAAQPWMLVVVSRTDDAILAFELLHEPPTPDRVRQILREALSEPAAGKAHRPTEILVRQEAWATALRPILEPLNIECQVVETLDQIDEVFEELAARLPASTDATGLLDMPGVTAEAVAGLFDAAASYYEQEPWLKAGERPIQVACSQFESSPWYAVILGQGGMTRGLILYDRLDTLRRIQQGELPEEENARLTTGLTVVFGDQDDLLPKDAEAMRKHGWKVAGPEGFPSVYRIEPGLSIRPPLAWEVQLLEGSLRAVPEFVRKKTRRLAPLELAVPTGGGELQMVVSWAGE